MGAAPELLTAAEKGVGPDHYITIQMYSSYLGGGLREGRGEGWGRG